MRRLTRKRTSSRSRSARSASLERMQMGKNKRFMLVLLTLMLFVSLGVAYVRDTNPFPTTGLVTTKYLGTQIVPIAAPTCAGRCNYYNVNAPCQCDLECMEFGDCCSDTFLICQPQPVAIAPAPAPEPGEDFWTGG